MISMVRIHCTLSTARLATHCKTVTVFSARFGATAVRHGRHGRHGRVAKACASGGAVKRRSTTFLATLREDREVKKCAKVLDKKVIEKCIEESMEETFKRLWRDFEEVSEYSSQMWRETTSDNCRHTWKHCRMTAESACNGIEACNVSFDEHQQNIQRARMTCVSSFNHACPRITRAEMTKEMRQEPMRMPLPSIQ